MQRRVLLEQANTAGHELAVHGWTHDCVLRVPSGELAAGVERTAALIHAVTGARPRWYRPPFGVLTLAARDAARAADLTPVLWSVWGRDWSRFVTPAGITRRVARTLLPGGTVLLHDTDRYASPGSWLRTAAALDDLLTSWRERQVAVGPLAEHWA